MRRVYLDHQAATPVLPEVFEAMRPYFTEAFGSASSIHQHGLRARDVLANAREQTARLINASFPEEIIFTSGGTESANLAIKGVAYANQRRGNHLVVSATEHPSVLNSIESLAQQGFTVTRVPVDAEGFVEPAAIRAAITEQTILIAVHHANHELGTIEPIREIGALAGERGIAFFVDATATGGWLPIDVQAMGASLLSLSPHRFYGPKGVGVLYRHRRARLVGVQHGGDQEGGRRAGTENIPAIVGAGFAAEIAARELPKRMAHTARLQTQLWDAITKNIEFIRLNGPLPGARRMPTNLNVSFEFVEGEGLALMLDMNGIAVASGPACVTKSLKISPTLTAIGLPIELAKGNLLFSLGQENTTEDIDCAAYALAKAVAKLRGMSPSWDEFQRGGADSLTRPRTSQPQR